MDTLFPQSILPLNLQKLYYTKKEKTIDFLSLLADCSNQNGFEKQTVKIRFKKNISGSIPAQLRVGYSIFFSVLFFRFVLYSVCYTAPHMQIDSERVTYR
jgi:hypothetical protein